MGKLLEHRVALISGADGGLGQSIARTFAEEGARVILTGLHGQALSATAQELRDLGYRAASCEMNVSSISAVRSAFDFGERSFGPIDLLVNNAGIARLADSFDVSETDFMQTLQINLVGAFNCCKIFAQRLRAKDIKGNIVNIASNAGRAPFAGMVDYNASKAALINLTRSLSIEFAPYHINVNALCPGAMDTGMLTGVAEYYANQNGSEVQATLSSFAPPQLGRLIQPDEVARVVAFLGSSAAEIIRGQSINVDGGLTYG